MIKQGYRKPKNLTKYQRNRIVDNWLTVIKFAIAIAVVVLCIIYNDVIFFLTKN